MAGANYSYLCFRFVPVQEKLEALGSGGNREATETDAFSSKNLKSKLGSSTPSSSKIKASHKLKAQTSRIVSSFKNQSVLSSIVREYDGHKDGVWQVTAKIGQPIIGTASADHSACIWGIESGRCLLQYQGHSGSVNSIKFHSSKDLVLTGSGDSTAHIWQAAVNWDVASASKKGHSSEEDLDEDELLSTEDRDRVDILRTPLCEFGSPISNVGHTSVVVMADWLWGADQIITASWDRTAILWDIETKESLQTLSGHDHELTHVSAHPSQRLVVTASRDSTFRLWDFRDQIPVVSVFQGHTESVTSTVLTRDDKVVSGSDDRTVKVWELRNMRSALTTIRTDSAVNRISVSLSGVIAIPHDNRQIRLFDLNGQRIARLPRTSRQVMSIITYRPFIIQFCSFLDLYRVTDVWCHQWPGPKITQFIAIYFQAASIVVCWVGRLVFPKKTKSICQSCTHSYTCTPNPIQI